MTTIILNDNIYTDSIIAQEIGKQMEKYGGSFMKHIGRALQNADIDNIQKIKNTWHNEWIKYKHFGKNTCLYCGKTEEKNNILLLCEECQEDFGHKYITEL